MPRFIRHILGLSLFLFGLYLPINGQCTYNTELNLAPLQSYFIPLEITGITNNDLANPTQGICGVLLDFEHQQIGSLTIELISPGGQVVTLVGPAFGSALTSFSNWDIGFLPCGSGVIPDPGFNPQWTNLDPWGIFSAYSGNYHPNAGCLEDFNSGSVNGTWTLHIICNNPFYSGMLNSFTLIFCDPNGLDCIVCDAAAGEFNLDSIQLCGSASLDTNDFIPQYGNNLPDPAEYSYLYLLSQNGIITDTSSQVDFLLTPGTYLVCGLSYRNDASDSLPSNGTLLFALTQDLQSQDPAFCGDITDQCVQVKVADIMPVTQIQATICGGDSILFGNEFFNQNGIHRDTLFAASGCDSIIELDLTILQSSIQIPAPDTLGCGNFSVLLDTILLNHQPPFSLISLQWLDNNHSPISNMVPLTVSSPGWYFLQWTEESGQVICSHVDSILVLEFPPMVDTFSVIGPDTICINQPVWIHTFRPDVFSLEWDPGANGLITQANDDSILVSWNISGQVNLCISFISNCDTAIKCKSIFILDDFPVFAGNDTILCSVGGQLNGSGQGKWESTTSGVVFGDIFDPESSIAVSNPGVYEIIRVPASICGENDTVTVEFVDQISVEISIEDTVCLGTSIDVEIKVPAGSAYDIWVSTQDNSAEFLNISGNGHWIIQENASTWIVVDSIAFYGQKACLTLMSDSVWLEVSKPASAMVYTMDTICNDHDDPLQNIIDFRDLVFGGDITGVFTNLNGIPLPGFPNATDFTGILSGLYPFAYTTAAAQPPCADSTYTFSILVQSCACPVLQLFPDLDLCNLDSLVKLPDPGLGFIDGSWNLVSGPILDPIIVQDSIVTIFQKEVGDYILKWKPDLAFPVGCLDSVKLSAHLFEGPNAGIVPSNLVFCAGLDSVVHLSDAITGQDLNGDWVASTMNPMPLLSGDSIRLDSSILGGLYLFYYIVQGGSAICQPDTSLVQVEILPGPIVTISGDTILNCNNTAIVLNGHTSSQILGYSWLDIAGNELSITDTLAVIAPGIYQLDVVDQLGCRGGATIQIYPNQNQITDLFFHVVTPACQNTSQSLLTIDSIKGGTDPFDISINGGPYLQGSNFQGFVEGWTYLTLRDRKFCTLEDSFYLESGTNFSVKILGEIKLKRGEHSVLQFETLLPSDSITSIEWYQEDLLICNICQDLDIAPDKTTIYQVKITSKAGCIAWASIQIFINQEAPVFVPNGFSPNGDGNNDLLVVNAYPDLLEIQQWYIYDRWGDLVFAVENGSPNDPAFGWDGTLKGKPLNPAVFTYVLICRFTNGDTYSQIGDILLIR